MVMEKNFWEKIKEWTMDSSKGVLGAIGATLVLTLLQYIGAHIPDILQWISQFAAATATIKITKK